METGLRYIDLSLLPAPKVVETLDFEAILDDMKADLQARYPNYGALVESDPALKVLEVAAYREVLVRQRVNEAARAVMVAFATGSDLDNLAALVPVTRNDGEGDPSFRERVQLAPEAFSVAGPQGAYVFWGKSASVRVKDVSAVSPTPGDVLVTVLSHEGDGTAVARESVAGAEVTLSGGSVVLDGENITALVVSSYSEGADYTFDAGTSTLYRRMGGGIAEGETLTVSYDRSAELELVENTLARENVRPLTDNVTVQGATIVNYTVDATLNLYPGPEAEVVRQAAEAAVTEYVEAQHRLGRDVSLSGIYEALHRPGVQRVDLTSPAAGITVASNEAAFCTGVTVTLGATNV